MAVPLAVLSGPFWSGVLPGGALLGAMHLMLPAMWCVIMRRPDKYPHGHHGELGRVHSG